MPGAEKTLREIKQQPADWTAVLKLLKQTNLQQLVGGFAAKEWVFVGCGTSYYLAQAAAASFTQLTGRMARALPASEIILHSALAIPDPQAVFPVLISRSGHTSEILAVADQLKRRGIEFLALTCDGRELAAMTGRVLRLPVHEESTVMTSSFSSMLLSMQFVAATLASDEGFLAELERLPALVEKLIAVNEPRIAAFAAEPFRDIAVLGQGALYAIAQEVALKVMEASSTYAQFFHALEFRHGPKSIVNPEVVVASLISETSFAEESKVLTEMKALGARTLAIANRSARELEGAAGLLIELALPVSETARLVAYVVWGQLLGCYAGLAKGLTPDEPTNLSRVVTI